MLQSCVVFLKWICCWKSAPDPVHQLEKEGKKSDSESDSTDSVSVSEDSSESDEVLLTSAPGPSAPGSSAPGPSAPPPCKYYLCTNSSTRSGYGNNDYCTTCLIRFHNAHMRFFIRARFNNHVVMFTDASCWGRNDDTIAGLSATHIGLNFANQLPKIAPVHPRPWYWSDLDNARMNHNASRSDLVEALAIIRALERVESFGLFGQDVTIFTDSFYIVRAMNDLARHNGGALRAGNPFQYPLNQQHYGHYRDTIERLYALKYSGSFLSVNLLWSPGHIGIRGNEYVDEMARRAHTVAYCRVCQYIPCRFQNSTPHLMLSP